MAGPASRDRSLSNERRTAPGPFNLVRERSTSFKDLKRDALLPLLPHMRNKEARDGQSVRPPPFPSSGSARINVISSLMEPRVEIQDFQNLLSAFSDR